MRFTYLLASIALVCSFESQAGELQFSSTIYTAAENVTPLVITVTRTGDTTAPATVAIASADIGSTAGSDYTAVSTTLSWAADDAASKTVDLALLDDALLEGSETLRLTLSAPTGDTLGTDSIATVTITDFEEGKLAFSSATYNVPEDNGTASITVSRTLGTSGEVEVSYATTAGTATSPEYFTATSGTLTFGDGIASQTISVPVIDNALGELDTALTLTLTLPVGGATLGSLTTATLNILNDDADFTASLTLISPTVTDITQPASVNLAQNSPLDDSNSLLETINRVSLLAATDLEAVQTAADGIVAIDIGDVTAHFFPYAIVRLDSIEDSEIYLNLDLSGRIVTDEGFQIEFEPALASISTLLTFLTELGTPEITITEYGNITVQLNQGPPPLEVDDNGKVYIVNSYYDRFNLRPGITSSVLDAGSGVSAGIYVLEHASVPGGAYIEVVYGTGQLLRHQALNTAPAIADEYVAGLQSLTNVSNVRLSANGTSTFDFGGRTHRMYADFFVRRVDPASYSGTLATGLFAASDLNGDGTADYRMVYSNGDEQYFFYFNPL